MTDISELKKKWLTDPKVKEEYQKLSPEFELAKTFIKARTKAGFTQQEIAKKMGTTQSVIARLESGKVLPSMKTIVKYAEATGTRPTIHFVSNH